MALEKSITNSILAYLNSLPYCRAEKAQGGAIASGRADINACYRGRTLRIEVKTPDHKNKASEKQRHNLEKWYKAGAIVMTVYSLNAVKDFLKYAIDPTIIGEFSKSYIENGCASWVRFRGEL